MKKNLKRAAAGVGALFASASMALAQQANLSVTRPSNVKIDDLGRFISSLVGLALIVAALLVFGYLILGGIQWITSGGDKGKTEAARNQITAALVGLAIVAAAYAIMQVIGYFFGFNIGNLQESLESVKPF